MYTSYGPIKSVDHTQYFKENAADIMSFIITLCVISIPVIELANQKIAAINAMKNDGSVVDPSTVQITNQMISQAVRTMYGLNLEFILATIEGVVGVFVKTLVASGAGAKIATWIKSKCCCCCTTAHN